MPHDERWIQVAEQSRDQKVSIVAVAAWLAWDALINLADEISYLWSGRGKWIKAMYAFIRYGPIIHQGICFIRFIRAQHSITVCRGWSSYTMSFIETLTIAVELVLVVRVFALYKLNHTVFRIICGVFITEIVLMVVLLAVAIPQQLYSPQCLSVRFPRLFVGYWLTSLIFEMFLWGLTVAKVLCSGARYLPARGRRSFTYLIMRDGTWAFAVIFLAMLTSTLTFQLIASPRAGIGYQFVLGVLSFSGSHVILNIRRLATPEEHLPETSSEISLDTVHVSPPESPHSEELVVDEVSRV